MTVQVNVYNQHVHHQAIKHPAPNTTRTTRITKKLCRNIGKLSSSAKKRGARLHLEGEKQKQQGSHLHERSSRIHINRYGNFKRIRETIKNTSKYKSDPFGNVVNLSNLEFSIPVYKLLAKNFCPTPTKLDKNSMNKELDSFFRRIKLREHFGNDTEKQTAITEEDTFKPRGAWEPNHTRHTVDTFCDAVKNETEQNRKTVKLRNNISKDELTQRIK